MVDGAREGIALHGGDVSRTGGFIWMWRLSDGRTYVHTEQGKVQWGEDAVQLGSPCAKM